MTLLASEQKVGLSFIEGSRSVLTQEVLKSHLRYDPDTGSFWWLSKGRNGKRSLSVEAGGIHSNGYRYISVLGRLYLAHRLAVLWMTGEWPEADTDHEEGDRSNNRWAKIRPATRSQNLGNMKMRASNTSGWKGVVRSRRKWRAQITNGNGGVRYLGVFDCPAAAHLAYLTAADRAFGSFARAA